ncbi:hypothetical protein P168DRAFT_82137 [Aspergillus campestris IBT 28561]|uniref:Na+/H+ antiporter Nha1 n=1 Tax=Aspergillus campestris (strain IBT 28561) TaxID=1392248 RepID=A0A2I1CQS7_ASPC2|nr:uncharacterized protein P168DRAFT_82137 [Aspergillus campestris IBT 28561]PKX99974.1 hypothetical protein P168DRAFT_82137 [Aspergillus campestris IBT 28561]
MAWDHLDIDKPHLAYMILGGFTGLFMLCSLFVKEKLYIGEATVATLCGIIFGPHAANLFNPLSWGNVDKITLECSRIVLVVQCFAVGVELPKAYMGRHWKSVIMLLGPVMTWGWLITSLFIWWMAEPLSWVESLVCAACVTATDPVLASSVVGKGKFAKRVPKHLRDLLSAESGCNDGMAFPFIYLSFYILRYASHPSELALHWFCISILYECVVGAIFGLSIGYLARHAIRLAERKGLIDRESFLVFYFVLAVFCAGSGSLLGMDDLLIGFCAGVGFSNDGWFTEKTEESHVSNVIDLLLNLAYFVYFGSIIPWEDYNNHAIGLTPWRLVVIALLVIFFRRLPIMMLLKPVIPDVKTWREALFAGHFGPIGVGAIFAAILARAELENDSTQPLSEAELPKAGTKDYYVVQLIWPITTFLVISSILVHGSSIAVFTLGKRINTLTVTLSYTQANEEGPSWMNRLPRVQSLAKGSMSFRKTDELEDSTTEPEYPPGTLPPIGMPGNFLRRQRDEDESPQGRTPSRTARRRRRHRGRSDGAGGPISQSAIAPQRPSDNGLDEKQDSIAEQAQRDRIERGASPPSHEADRLHRVPVMEVYLEGHHMVMEDEDGNVLRTEDVSHISPEERDRHIEEQRVKLLRERPVKGQAEIAPAPTPAAAAEETPAGPLTSMRQRLARFVGMDRSHPSTPETPDTTATTTTATPAGPSSPAAAPAPKPKGKARSAHAYQFGNTIIVEDEDGEVLKKYSIPSSSSERPEGAAPVRRGLTRMGTWFGMEEKDETAQQQKQTAKNRQAARDEWMADDGLRFTIAADDTVGRRGVGHKGTRMTKHQFAEQLRGLGPRARRTFVEESDAPERVKDAARSHAEAAEEGQSQQPPRRQSDPGVTPRDDGFAHDPVEAAGRAAAEEDLTSSSEVSDEADRAGRASPGNDVAASLARVTRGSAAQARRSNLGPSQLRARRDSEDDGTDRVPPSELRQAAGLDRPPQEADLGDTGETPAERRRRLAALGELASDSDSASEDDDEAIESGSEDGDEDRRGKSGRGESSSSESGQRHRTKISWGGEKGR